MMKSKETPVPLPQPPNYEEMMEDLESCQKNDPVFLLAEVLDKRGKRRQSLVDFDSDLSELLNCYSSASQKNNNSSSTPASPSRTTSVSGGGEISETPTLANFASNSGEIFEESPDVSFIRYKLRRRKGSSSTSALSNTNSHSPSSSTSALTETERIEETYENFTQFLKMMEKTEGLIHTIEPRLKNLQIDFKEFNKIVSDSNQKL